MGALHAGHLSLFKRAAQDCDLVVASIFVNPTQFGANEDFNKYPRLLQQDLQLASNSGVGAAFTPAVEDMYGEGFQTTILPGTLAVELEGAHRPGHFAGVCTVVSKLLNIVQPDRAFFGQKDFQQARVIEQMVHGLNFSAEIVVAPTVRAEDGLALSSRNAYLSPEERVAAAAISDGLKAALQAYNAGEWRSSALTDIVLKRTEGEQLIAMEYCVVANSATLHAVETVGDRPSVILVAAAIGATRLIDNILLPAVIAQ